MAPPLQCFKRQYRPPIAECFAASFKAGLIDDLGVFAPSSVASSLLILVFSSEVSDSLMLVPLTSIVHTRINPRLCLKYSVREHSPPSPPAMSNSSKYKLKLFYTGAMLAKNGIMQHFERFNFTLAHHPYAVLL